MFRVASFVVFLAAMKQSPSKKRQTVRQRSVTNPETDTRLSVSAPSIDLQHRSNSDSKQHHSSSSLLLFTYVPSRSAVTSCCYAVVAGAVGGRPDLLPSATPPPSYTEELPDRSFRTSASDSLEKRSVRPPHFTNSSDVHWMRYFCFVF